MTGKKVASTGVKIDASTDAKIDAATRNAANAVGAVVGAAVDAAVDAVAGSFSNKYMGLLKGKPKMLSNRSMSVTASDLLCQHKKHQSR